MANKKKTKMHKIIKMKKTKKSRLPKMIIFLLLAVSMIVMVNARNDFTQEVQSGSFNASNNYILTRISMDYSSIDKPKSWFSSILDFGSVKDYIRNGRPSEIGLSYASYIKDWNTQFPDNTVSICQLQIRKLNEIQNIMTLPLSQGVLLEKNFTENTDTEDYYIVKLYNGDYFYSTFLCLYNNLSNINNTGMMMPISLYAYTPTHNCKACQYSEFSRHISDVEKKDKFEGYSYNVKNYISGLIDISFAIFLYSFWIFLIIMLFFIISMLFWSGYWLYFYIRSLGK